MTVVVVGAGLSGLASATALHRAGCEVEILEAASAVGGPITQRRIDGASFDCGPRWFERDGVVDAWFEARGLAGEVVPYEWETRTLGSGGALEAGTHAQRLPGEPTSKGSGPAARRWTLGEGLGSLPRRLANKRTVRVGWAAEAIEPDPLGARVRFIAPSGERTMRAEAVVLAVPAAEAVKIAPELTAAERAVLADVETEPCGVVHLALAAQDEREGDVEIDASSGLDLAGWSLRHAGPGSTLRVALRAEAIDRLRSAPSAAWADHVLGQLEHTPLGKLEPLASCVERAHVECSAAEAWAAVRARSERLVLAGAALEGGGIRGALRSGQRAAERVLERL